MEKWKTENPSLPWYITVSPQLNIRTERPEGQDQAQGVRAL